MAEEVMLEHPREENNLGHRRREDQKESYAASFEASCYNLLPAPATFSMMGYRNNVVHLHLFDRANPERSLICPLHRNDHLLHK